MSGRPRKPEVLAPAGSLPALRAALQHGADAVYFGLQDGFNARARAANFALADLPAVVARCHRAGARAYVTLNTLVFEPELPALERVLRAIAAAGVDALIVQDPAVCLLAHAVCPELELHASTQMTIAEPAAAAFAAGLGVRRIVVPRELSVDEIRAFAAGTPLELEVFVHGALCVSWSGQCLTSEAWGGRSANRGQCAQSCRMPYELVLDGERRDLGDVQYLLSPKDLAGVRAVPDLLAIGVHGLKIEGRQKGPAYVATATGGYRRWVDSLAADGDRKAAERQLAQDLLAMSLAYSRGFSDGFLGGSDHQALVEGRFPKHRGVLVGRVVQKEGNAVLVLPDPEGRPWTGALALRQRPPGPTGERSAELAPAGEQAALELRPGMGVVFDQGEPEDQHEPGGALFHVERRGGALRLGFGQPGPDLARVRVGDRVWATSDPVLAAAVQREVRETAPEPEGRLPIDLQVAGRAGEPLVVHALCGGHVAVAATAVPLQPARGAGLEAGLLADKVGAFGGTPFRLGRLDVSRLAPGLHAPASELKELRRRLVAALLPAIERGPERRLEARPALPRVRESQAGLDPLPAGEPALVPLVRSETQLEAALAGGCAEVELDWMEFTGLGRAVDRARRAGARITLATTRVGKPGEEALVERLRRLAPDAILVRHLGALMRCLEFRAAGDRFRLHGDFSLNATNSLTARHLLGLGLDTITAAFDLDEAQLAALAAAVPGGRLAVVVQHRIPTFHTEHCVYAHLLSQGRDYRSCGRPCERHQLALRDHQGREHPVIVDVGCRNTVFHHAPQQSAAWVGGLLAQGVRRFRVEFVREGAAEVERTLAAWRDLLAGRADAEGLARRTGATSQFGVAQGGMRLLAE
ncbi:MAG: U32 family peptidase [Planctomycetes bacterium]|nr:U32 family peptidase [Planctomycetota bacterium]